MHSAMWFHEAFNKLFVQKTERGREGENELNIYDIKMRNKLLAQITYSKHEKHDSQ